MIWLSVMGGVVRRNGDTKKPPILSAAVEEAAVRETDRRLCPIVVVGPLNARMHQHRPEGSVGVGSGLCEHQRSWNEGITENVSRGNMLPRRGPAIVACCRTTALIDTPASAAYLSGVAVLAFSRHPLPVPRFPC